MGGYFFPPDQTLIKILKFRKKSVQNLPLLKMCNKKIQGRSALLLRQHNFTSKTQNCFSELDVKPLLYSCLSAECLLIEEANTYLILECVCQGVDFNLIYKKHCIFIFFT